MILDAHEASSDRGHEDQSPVRLAVLECSLADEELCPRIKVEDMVELLLSYVLRLVPRLRAGVAHHEIDLAKMLLAFLKEPRNLGDLADIGLNRHGFRAILEGLDLGNNFFGGIFGGLVVDDNRTAATAEFDGT